jgi:hypothetical protein
MRMYGREWLPIALLTIRFTLEGLSYETYLLHRMINQDVAPHHIASHHLT